MEKIKEYIQGRVKICTLYLESAVEMEQYERAAIFKAKIDELNKLLDEIENYDRRDTD